MKHMEQIQAFMAKAKHKRFTRMIKRKITFKGPCHFWLMIPNGDYWDNYGYSELEDMETHVFVSKLSLTLTIE